MKVILYGFSVILSWFRAFAHKFHERSAVFMYQPLGHTTIFAQWVVIEFHIITSVLEIFNVMNKPDTKLLAPILYLPHGGGPRPLMNDPGHAGMVDFWQDMAKQFPQPDAIIVISAHWEADVATVTANAAPAMYYDYYNFPPETYQYQYPAPGNPALAQQMAELLAGHNIQAKQDPERGYDHGLFVPLMLMYPQADIPCVELSLLSSLDASQHIELGQALASLREQNILVIGSGMSFHNFTAMRRNKVEDQLKSQAFDNWLVETCCSEGVTPTQRQNRLTNWESAPDARFCHPREEHLLPLHVCFGMASGTTPRATHVYSDAWMGLQISAFLW